MKCLMVLSCCVLSAAAFAEDRAATTELPAAVRALGVGSRVVSQSEARAVRGTGTSIPFQQLFTMNVTGEAIGKTTILEGMIGQIQLQNGGLVIQGTFGGLAGTVAASETGVQFALQGKAIQQVIDFQGTINQALQQQYLIAP